MSSYSITVAIRVYDPTTDLGAGVMGMDALLAVNQHLPSCP